MTNTTIRKTNKKNSRPMILLWVEAVACPCYCLQPPRYHCSHNHPSLTESQTLSRVIITIFELPTEKQINASYITVASDESIPLFLLSHINPMSKWDDILLSVSCVLRKQTALYHLISIVAGMHQFLPLLSLVRNYLCDDWINRKPRPQINGFSLSPE